MFHRSEVTNLRRKVLAEITRLTKEGRLEEEVVSLLNTVVTEDGPRYRCCIHKERAILKDRINLALSQPMDSRLETAAAHAMAGEISRDMPIVNIMPGACDQCPLDKFMVTDACRNCLAHHCIASCPKQAIMVVQNRAYIDKTRCVECGLCKKACPYGAIIEITRPCERACELGAIQANDSRKAVIDYQACVQCGACKNACPFGAIGDRSVIVQLLQAIKSGRKVHAMLAPSFAGQFGMKVQGGHVAAGLEAMGFAKVWEASLGADIVALTEAEEWLERVPDHQKFLTTSCCPAFVAMVEKHQPEMKNHVSTTVSPMIAVAQLIKKEDPEALVAFVGPCLAKKAEGEANGEQIDFVLTFEELGCMWDGYGIDPAALTPVEWNTAASRDGNGFARAGGVAKAVADVTKEIAPEASLLPHCCEGLAQCKKAVEDLQAGKLQANLLEGMACAGGCVGGPGVLVDARVSGRMVDQYSGGAGAEKPQDNGPAKELKAGQDWHHSHKED